MYDLAPLRNLVLLLALGLCATVACSSQKGAPPAASPLASVTSGSASPAATAPAAISALYEIRAQGIEPDELIAVAESLGPYPQTAAASCRHAVA